MSHCKFISTYNFRSKLPDSPSSAHPAGSSIMLLGGFGFLSRLYGLSVDNLVEVEMVLADGRIVVVNENEHSGTVQFVIIIAASN